MKTLLTLGQPAQSATPRTDARAAEILANGWEPVSRLRVFAGQLERENAELLAALSPFAVFADRLMDGRRGIPPSGAWFALDSGTEKEAEITIEHLKAARSAIANARAGGKQEPPAACPICGDPACMGNECEPPREELE